MPGRCECFQRTHLAWLCLTTAAKGGSHTSFDNIRSIHSRHGSDNQFLWAQPWRTLMKGCTAEVMAA